ncbi:MAG: hypothetical protein COB46_08135 [Rhodospirillaceae bacterium]|nr:MAG: hypothetical protein COB46_08135 [Rhodospirillaceae bacterium]
MVFVGILGLAGALSGSQASAESPYPREQVEEHLRTMFLDKLTDDSLDINDTNFGFFSLKKEIRFSILGLKETEVDSAKTILINLFANVIKVPPKIVDPTQEKFDVLLLISDNLPIDAKLPIYRKFLKLGNQTEEDYLKTFQKKRPTDFTSLMQMYIGAPGEIYIVLATERDHPQTYSPSTFEQMFSYALFQTLTGAENSNVIKPSAVNHHDKGSKVDGFSTIDRAVLRSLFAHDDWLGMKYEPRLKLLIDRVMTQLKLTPN